MFADGDAPVFSRIADRTRACQRRGDYTNPLGDVHGHLMPRPSLRSGSAAGMEGGLARMYTKISQIRAERSKDKTLLLNTGDTIQGSVEALFTKRQALVDVLNRFAIDAYAPAGRLKLIEPMPITSFGKSRNPTVARRRNRDDI